MTYADAPSATSAADEMRHAGTVANLVALTGLTPRLEDLVVKRRPLHRMPMVAVAALALTGCGLAEYEKKMMDAEARVQRFDEDNRLLGAPLTFPTDPAPPMILP